MNKFKRDKKCNELAELEADYFSKIQFPVQWVGTGMKDLKQDINTARRKRCFDDHKWGFQKGFEIGYAEAQAQAKVLVEALKKYADKNNWKYWSNFDVGAFDETLTFKPDIYCKTQNEAGGGYTARQALEQYKAVCDE